MKDISRTRSIAALPQGAVRPSGWITRLMARRGFQRWAARFPLTRGIVRREGAAMFDLVAGFCYSQILQAFVRLDLHNTLLHTEMTPEAIAHVADLRRDRVQILLDGATAIGLVRRKRSGHIALTRRGAALAGVPGLADMIDHHDILYLDLADPVAFFRDEVETELAGFWPYVFGAGGASDPAVTERYSQLMADSQVLVAEDTLAAVDLGQARHIMDVGGGSGAFLLAVAKAHRAPRLTLFDLPAVAPAAEARFLAAGQSGRLKIVGGSFRDDALPRGADVITLVRVLYDHSDDTVGDLLDAVHEALPEGGRVVISEPMTGGARPERAGDGYFALYCMAMRTGRARAPARIAQMLEQAGFSAVKVHRSRRPYITTVISAVKQA